MRAIKYVNEICKLNKYVLIYNCNILRSTHAGMALCNPNCSSLFMKVTRAAVLTLWLHV